MVIVKCPSDMSVYNGNVRFSGDGTSVTYQCANGFRLVGSASATCQENGTWSSLPPRCTGMINVTYRL